MANNNLRGLGTTSGLTNCVVTILFYVLATIAVALRVWAIRISRREYRPDDWLSFAALLWASGFLCLSLMSMTLVIINMPNSSRKYFALLKSSLGIFPGVVGMHVADVMADPDLGLGALSYTLKLYYAAAYVWITATSLTKLSVLYLYVSIFKSQKFCYTAATIGSLLVAFWLGDIITAITQCNPIAKNWNVLLPGKCASSLDIQLATATLNMLFDLAIVILPMPKLWRLQMALKKKIMVTGVMSLGLCICAMNIARISLEARADQNDFSFTLNYAGMFAGLEVFIGIIVSCMTACGPVFARDKFKCSTRQHNLRSPASASVIPTNSHGKIRLENPFQDKRFECWEDDGILLKNSSSILSYGGPASTNAWATLGEGGSSLTHLIKTIPEGTISVQTEIDTFAADDSKRDWGVV